MTKDSLFACALHVLGTAFQRTVDIRHRVDCPMEILPPPGSRCCDIRAAASMRRDPSGTGHADIQKAD